jgi:hypothetical protein
MIVQSLHPAAAWPSAGADALHIRVSRLPGTQPPSICCWCAHRSRRARSNRTSPSPRSDRRPPDRAPDSISADGDGASNPAGRDSRMAGRQGSLVRSGREGRGGVMTIVGRRVRRSGDVPAGPSVAWAGTTSPGVGARILPPMSFALALRLQDGGMPRDEDGSFNSAVPGDEARHDAAVIDLIDTGGGARQPTGQTLGTDHPQQAPSAHGTAA